MQRLLLAYPEAKLLGLSATNVRYLDNQRDMADELFDGNVASEMTLGEAIVRGILNAPTYVLSVFAYQQDYDRLKSRVHRAKSKATRDAAEKYTVSPIIYKQQIGRALSASKAKEPVIFDIVNNIENLYSISTVEQEMQAAVNYYRFLGEGGMVVNERFRVIDELRDARELFEQLNDTLSASWDTMYEYAKQYHDEHGDLDVPRRYKTADGYSLGAWLMTQRKVYAGIQYGVLGEDRIQKLEAIGMRWGSKFERSWERGLAEAKDYYNKHGDLNVPTMYVAPSGFKLGGWIADRREKGREKRSMERRRQLDALGMVWQKPDPWEVRYAAAKAYFIEHGDLNMPAQYKANGMWLAKWLNEQRQIYIGNRPGKSLTTEQVRRLEAIGMTWGKRSNYKKTRHAIESENSLYGHQAV